VLGAAEAAKLRVVRQFVFYWIEPDTAGSSHAIYACR
jgi:hypothetical protein